MSAYVCGDTAVEAVGEELSLAYRQALSAVGERLHRQIVVLCQLNTVFKPKTRTLNRAYFNSITRFSPYNTGLQKCSVYKHKPFDIGEGIAVCYAFEDGRFTLLHSSNHKWHGEAGGVSFLELLFQVDRRLLFLRLNSNFCRSTSRAVVVLGDATIAAAFHAIGVVDAQFGRAVGMLEDLATSVGVYPLAVLEPFERGLGFAAELAREGDCAVLFDFGAFERHDNSGRFVAVEDFALGREALAVSGQALDGGGRLVVGRAGGVGRDDSVDTVVVRRALVDEQSRRTVG